MRKVIFILLGFIVLLPVLSAISLAQTDSGVGVSAPASGITYPEPYPVPDGRPSFMGQDHSYTLTFRGNGEAVVALRVILANRETTPLTKTELRIPKVEPRELSVYQVIKEPYCLRYLPQTYDATTGTYKPLVCAQYQDADYYQYWGAAKYQKAKFTYEGDTLSIDLPTPLKANSSGSYFVYFRTFGYAKKTIFDAFKYEFESLKANETISNLLVGITTDSDLHLKGVQTNVNYRFEAPQLATLEAQKAGVAAEDAGIDQFYQSIGQGSIVKTASNLSALESYTVTGAYSKSLLGLYGREILIAVLVLAAIVLILVAIARLILKKSKTGPGRAKSQGVALSPDSSKLILLTVGASFIQAVVIAGYSIFIVFLGENMSNLLGYQYQTFFVLFLVIISFCVYSLVLFGPAVLLGVKKGVGWGVLSVVLAIVWLVVFMILGFIIVFLLNGSQYPAPIPLMKGAAGAAEDVVTRPVE